MDDTTGTVADPAPPVGRWSVGGLLIEALASQDFVAIADCLDRDVRLRTLHPDGPVETVGREQVVGMFRRWFGGPGRIAVLDATIGEVGPRLYLRWRIGSAGAAPAVPGQLVEQHVFASIAGRISALDLLSSGFVAQSNDILVEGSSAPGTLRPAGQSYRQPERKPTT
jgi:SnoaL-like domain